MPGSHRDRAGADQVRYPASREDPSTVTDVATFALVSA
jgi:hypothetical protein